MHRPVRRLHSGRYLTLGLIFNERLTTNYSDEVLLALGCSPEQFNEEAKLLVAIKLYELGRLSSGAAAKLADIPKLKAPNQHRCQQKNCDAPQLREEVSKDTQERA